MDLKRLRQIIYLIIFCVSSITLSGCNEEPQRYPIPAKWLSPYEYEDTVYCDDISSDDDELKESSTAAENADNEESIEYLHFYDVFRNEYDMEINNSIPANPYLGENYSYINKDLTGKQIVSEEHEFFVDYCMLPSGETMGYEGIIRYEDEKYSSKFGVDVSKFQKNIDWKKAKEAGVEFAVIRGAYRGYGKEGSLHEDPYFQKNIQNAKEEGIWVGVYIYSQATNEDEAIEEAQFILDIVNGYELELPIVYDPESVLNADARTDNVTPEQFTLNAIAFCNEIKAAGYEPMVYANMLWEAYQIDFSRLNGIPIWYADYERLPQTPYLFKMWQYSQCGKISGIPGTCDLNLLIVEK